MTSTKPLRPSRSLLFSVQSVGVNLYRDPPGKESTIVHLHQVEEEFVFVPFDAGEAE